MRTRIFGQRDSIIYTTQHVPDLMSSDVSKTGVKHTPQSSASDARHDAGRCKLYNTGLVPRALADAVFGEAMLVCGIPTWRAWAAWAAVRSVGWRFYKKATPPDILQMAAGLDDRSPMQFISAQLLERYRSDSAELEALRREKEAELG